MLNRRYLAGSVLIILAGCFAPPASSGEEAPTVASDLTYPVNRLRARIASGFGIRTHPILGYEKMHDGVDFAAYGAGASAFAIQSGTVEAAEMAGKFALQVRIRHSGNTVSTYSYLSGLLPGVTRGAQVEQGQEIGYFGERESNNSGGVSHLHFEILVNGEYVDPQTVLPPAQ
jgi:murein DD-endopeptidase MepM/ murein hydrolase activator NlpD